MLFCLFLTLKHAFTITLFALCLHSLSCPIIQFQVSLSLILFSADSQHCYLVISLLVHWQRKLTIHDEDCCTHTYSTLPPRTSQNGPSEKSMCYSACTHCCPFASKTRTVLCPHSNNNNKKLLTICSCQIQMKFLIFKWFNKIHKGIT